MVPKHEHNECSFFFIKPIFLQESARHETAHDEQEALDPNINKVLWLK